MLAFDVINLEQHRALQQNAARACLRRSRDSEVPLIALPLSGCKLSKLNRQIPELKRRVTSGKQAADTCSNRQRLQKRSRPISESTSVSSARVLETSATRKMEPLATKNEAVLAKWAPTSNRKWRANRCYRKQIIKPCLTEARTRLRETAFSCNSQISAVALGDQFMLHSEAPERPSQSSNLARPYGRS